MALISLLAAGAEATATAFLGATFKGKRVVMRESIIQKGIEAIGRRVGRELSGADRRNARRIVEAAGEAIRVAKVANGEQSGTFSPRNVPTAPGRARGDDQLSWFVIVSSTDPVSGEKTRIPMDIRSGDNESPDDIKLRAIDRMSRGDVVPSYRNKVQGLSRNAVVEVDIVTVYRGFPRVE